MRGNQPTVTVLMPVYNAGPHLARALESILGQVFRDFEFLIIDDGSTDGSREIIRRYADPRIRFFENSSNLGLVSTLNRGLALARGKYLARMDQDDYSLPHRLEKQVLFMERNPETALCGSWIRLGGDVPPIEWPYPHDHEAICCLMLFVNPLAHPTVIWRTESFQRLGLRYDHEASFAEDFDLWERCSRQLRLANIPEVLLHYRISNSSMTHKYANELSRTAAQIFGRQLARLGIEADDATLELHRYIGNEILLENPDQLQSAKAYLERLLRGNHKHKIYPKEMFRKTLVYLWMVTCKKYRENRDPNLPQLYLHDLEPVHEYKSQSTEADQEAVHPRYDVKRITDSYELIALKHDAYLDRNFEPMLKVQIKQQTKGTGRRILGKFLAFFRQKQGISTDRV